MTTDQTLTPSVETALTLYVTKHNARNITSALLAGEPYHQSTVAELLCMYIDALEARLAAVEAALDTYMDLDARIDKAMDGTYIRVRELVRPQNELHSSQEVPGEEKTQS